MKLLWGDRHLLSQRGCSPVYYEQILHASTAFSKRLCLAVSSISPSFNWPHFSPFILFIPWAWGGGLPWAEQAGRVPTAHLWPRWCRQQWGGHVPFAPSVLKGPQLLLTAVSGLLCPKYYLCIGGQHISTAKLSWALSVLQGYVRSPQPHCLARVTPVPEVQRRFARAWLANSLLISSNSGVWNPKCLKK